MKLTTVLSFTLALFCTTAFGQKAKLTLNEIEKIKASSVKLVRYEAPKLYVMTPKDAVGEGLVAKWTKSEEADGKISEIKYNPDVKLQKSLDSLLKSNSLVGSLYTNNESQDFVVQKELKDVTRYQDSEEDYVFEIYVPAGLTWAASYTGVNWKKYWLTLGAELRIYRVSDNTLVHKDYAYLGGLNDSRLKFKLEELGDNASEKIQALVDIAAKEVAIKWIEKIQKVKK